MRFAQTRWSHPPICSARRTAHLPNELDERLLNKIVARRPHRDRGKGKGFELGGMSVEGRFDDEPVVETAGATRGADPT